jgi:hypothetical protein
LPVTVITPSEPAPTSVSERLVVVTGFPSGPSRA